MAEPIPVGNGAIPATADPNGSAGTGPAVGDMSPNEPAASADSDDPKDRLLREFQSRADRAEAKLSKYGSLTPEMLEQMGNPDQLIARSNVVDHLLRDDAGRQILTAIQNGQSIQSAVQGQTATGSEMEEEYLSDDQRRIQALEQKIRLIERGQGETTILQAQSQLTNTVGDLLENRFSGLTEERKKQLLDGAMSSIKNYENQGELGRQALTRLMSPEARSVVEGILKGQLTDDDMDVLAESRRRRKQGNLGALRTDSPSGTLSLSDEPPPDFLKGSSSLAEGALKALQYAKQGLSG